MPDKEQLRIFSENLSRLVERSGKSQKDIAADIGVSPQTFNTWIRGIALPRMGKVQLLADYFHVDKTDLIDAPKANKDSYYYDPASRDLADFLHKNPKYKVLFDASRKVKPEDIEFVKKMIDRMSGDDDDDPA